jgi:hypothetical protein
VSDCAPSNTLAPLALLTQHGKVDAVRAPLETAGFFTFLQSGVDTDTLGTFTGEVARCGSQRDAALTKAKMACELSGARFGLGSEGSFGPDPHLGVSPWGCEVLAWWDAESGYSVFALEQGLQTNFAQARVSSNLEARTFAAEVGFPAHGLIVGKPGEPCFTKSLPQDWNALHAAVAAGLAQGPVWLETDMRAHRNPTRLEMIGRCAVKLATQLRCQCPHCHAPGYGPHAPLRGEVCELCGLATHATRGHLLRCPCCGHEEEQLLRASVPASKCNYCNP